MAVSTSLFLLDNLFMGNLIGMLEANSDDMAGGALVLRKARAHILYHISGDAPDTGRSAHLYKMDSDNVAK